MKPREIVIDIASNGKAVELSVGDEIQIHLLGQGGTGYSWYFTEIDLDFFEIVSKDTKNLAPGKGDIGGNVVMMIWNLRVKKQGVSLITMRYFRIWEGKEKEVNTFTIEIKANE